MATTALMGKAGAKRIRFRRRVAWALSGPLEEYSAGFRLECMRAVVGLASRWEYENLPTISARARNIRDSGCRLGLASAFIPSFDLNHAYVGTDVFVSMAKLKNHATCGVTLSMKNCFGITPASIYGDNAGVDEPNETPTTGRGDVCHMGKRQPSKSALSEINPASSREPGYRMPRIVADLAITRPIDLAIIDGIESFHGQEKVRGSRSARGTAGIADRRNERAVYRHGGDRSDGLRSSRAARHAAIPRL